MNNTTNTATPKPSDSLGIAIFRAQRNPEHLPSRFAATAPAYRAAEICWKLAFGLGVA